MAKSLRAIATKNYTPNWPEAEPTDGLHKLKGKAFMAQHKASVRGDANGNDDEVFKASNVKKAPFPRADEETELDEMSPDVLSRYASRANVSRLALHKMAGKTLHKPDTPDTTKEYHKHSDKASKRFKFMLKAKSKIGEEEELDELSTATLTRYKSAARKQNDSIVSKSRKYGSLSDTNSKIHGKRLSGFHTAMRRLRAKTKDSKIDEATVTHMGHRSYGGPKVRSGVTLKGEKPKDPNAKQFTSFADMGKDLAKSVYSKKKTNEGVSHPGTRVVSKPHSEKGHKAYDVFFNDTHIGSIHSYTTKPSKHQNTIKVPGMKMKKPNLERWVSEPTNVVGMPYRKAESHYSKDSAIDSLKCGQGCYGEETLSELSVTKLMQYGKAASDQATHLRSSRNKFGSLSKTNRRIVAKRSEGLATARKKYEKKVSEEVEELDEKIKQKSLIKNKKQKTGVARKRSDRGMASTAKPFRKPRMRKEEALDETSVEKAMKYVEKAGPSYVSQVNKSKKFGSSKTNDRIKTNRRRGIIRAHKKIYASPVKEEEQLDELMAKGKLQKYANSEQRKSGSATRALANLVIGGPKRTIRKALGHQANAQRAASLHGYDQARRFREGGPGKTSNNMRFYKNRAKDWKASKSRHEETDLNLDELHGKGSLDGIRKHHDNQADANKSNPRRQEYHIAASDRASALTDRKNAAQELKTAKHNLGRAKYWAGRDRRRMRMNKD